MSLQVFFKFIQNKINYCIICDKIFNMILVRIIYKNVFSNNIFFQNVNDSMIGEQYSIDLYNLNIICILMLEICYLIFLGFKFLSFVRLCLNIKFI